MKKPERQPGDGYSIEIVNESDVTTREDVIAMSQEERKRYEQSAPKVLLAVHASSSYDGAMSIISHLSELYTPVFVNGEDVTSRFDWSREQSLSERIATARNETFFLEAPHPFTAADICAAASISPTVVTHVLLLVDATTLEADPYGNATRDALTRNGASAIGLGNVWNADRRSMHAQRARGLGRKTAGLLSYVETTLAPVPYLATGYFVCYDRSGKKVHELPEGRSSTRFGVPE